MEHSTREACSSSDRQKKFLLFMKPKGSLPSAHVPSAHHLPQFQARSIQSTLSQTISLRSIHILSPIQA